MTVEHRDPQSREPSRKNQYSNCLYACRFCNIARSNLPTVSDIGERLLDPTVDPWDRYFERIGDELRPRNRDANAAYTHQSYDLDDPRKVASRRFRQQLFADRLEAISRAPELIDKLLTRAEQCQETDPHRANELIEAAQALHTTRNNALAELTRYAAIPSDAPETCRCRTKRHHSLPPGLADQVMNIASK